MAAARRLEGNALLAKADYAGACRSYDEGLAAAGAGKGDRTNKPLDAERLALHLNASLAHLKRGNLATAVDHGTEALELDPQSVKALYRRGRARMQLSDQAEHHAEKELARKDLERVLELEPSNAEVRTHVQQLRKMARVEQRAQDKSQRETFKGLFARGKALYNDAHVAVHPPVIHEDNAAAGHELVLAARGVEHAYERCTPVLTGVDLELRAGWCVGLFGNNASGKTTLARLLTEKLSPSSGFVDYRDPGNYEASRRTAVSAASRATMGSATVLALLVAMTFEHPRVRTYVDTRNWRVWGAIATGAVLVLLLVFASLRELYAQRLVRRSRCVVSHVSSEMVDKEPMTESKTIEALIGEVMHGNETPAQRRPRVVAMLRAAGFQMYNQATGEPTGTPEDYVRDGLRYNVLSGGQKHLIYVLRCFARRPDVLVCDELLGGLDAWKQPRVLSMLKQLQKAGTAILFITCELHQLRIVADSLGFLADGRIAELGPVEEVLEFPKHPATKDYVGVFRGLPGGQVLGGKLAESYGAIANDPHLEGPWMPERRRT